MNKYVLITGASSGIGYELAKLFSNDGHNLILVARSLDNLKKVKEELNKNDVDIKIIALDLSIMEECDKLISFIEDNNLLVEILVNNAGAGSFGEFSNIEWSIEETLIDLNIKAVTKLTKYFLFKFIGRKSGGILNVASTAAFAAGPKMATYYGSKSYVLNLTEAIYEEVKDKGINVSCLCPGPVRTSFQGKAGIKKSEKAKKYLMEAEEVARIAYKDFRKGKVIIIPGFKNKLLVLGNKFLPRFTSRKIILKINKD